jgi:hypothetical protein
MLKNNFLHLKTLGKHVQRIILHFEFKLNLLRFLLQDNCFSIKLLTTAVVNGLCLKKTTKQEYLQHVFWKHVLLDSPK